MLNLSEYRKKNAALADFLPWAALIAPGVVLNKDGSFQRTARFTRSRSRQRYAVRTGWHHRKAQRCASPSRFRMGDLRRSRSACSAALS